MCRLCGQQSGICINIFDKNENHVKKISAVLPILVRSLPFSLTLYRQYYPSFFFFFLSSLNSTIGINDLTFITKLYLPLVNTRKILISNNKHEIKIYPPILGNLTCYFYPIFVSHYRSRSLAFSFPLYDCTSKLSISYRSFFNFPHQNSLIEIVITNYFSVVQLLLWVFPCSSISIRKK